MEIVAVSTDADFAEAKRAIKTVIDVASELDRIRQRCAQLNEEFPMGSSGGYCNDQGIEVLSYLETLRRPA